MTDYIIYQKTNKDFLRFSNGDIIFYNEYKEASEDLFEDEEIWGVVI